MNVKIAKVGSKSGVVHDYLVTAGGTEIRLDPLEDLDDLECWSKLIVASGELLNASLDALTLAVDAMVRAQNGDLWATGLALEAARAAINKTKEVVMPQGPLYMTGNGLVACEKHAATLDEDQPIEEIAPDDLAIMSRMAGHRIRCSACVEEE